LNLRSPVNRGEKKTGGRGERPSGEWLSPGAGKRRVLR